MPNKRTSQQQTIDQSEAQPQVYRMHTQERTRAALALLLGPETDHHIRLRARQRLARQGPAVLPLLLTILSSHTDITTPAWPAWPPQYEHLSHLLLHLSRSANLPLSALLQHPAISQPPGPVLWTSVIEAASLSPHTLRRGRARPCPETLSPHTDHETLLHQGLTAPWITTRYAAAIAIAQAAEKGSLSEPTLNILRTHQPQEAAIPVQLAAAYALLRQADSSAIETLITLLYFQAASEIRKAVAFVLATGIQNQEPRTLLSSSQHQRLTRLLLLSLQDHNTEVATHAAYALASIATPSVLQPLSSLLDSPHPHVQIAALAATAAIAHRNQLRRAIQRHTLSASIVALLHTQVPEVRQQAAHTLAACGGTYATAVLGATACNNHHSGHIEAIEALPLLHSVLHPPMRTNVVYWLLQALHQQQDEESKVAALTSLTHLISQARRRNQKKALQEITNHIALDETFSQLLTSPSPWVRQKAVELLSIFDSHLCTLQAHLHTDNDSGVRACIAYTLGQTKAYPAIPALIQALLDPDESVAETALNSLALLARPNDHIIIYVIKELATHNPTQEPPLAQSAQALLKKWQRKRSSEV